MNSKWIPLVLGSSLLFSSFGSVAAGASSDVIGHWAEQQLSDWSDKGYIQGYADGSLKPNQTVTRAEFVTLVNRAFGLSESGQVTFADVASSDWAYAEFGKAVKAGYINGYEDHTIRPDAPISRQEAAAIVANLLHLDTASAPVSDLARFTDASTIAEWSKETVAAVVARGLMDGYDDGTYRPDGLITRAEAVVTISRAANATAAVNTTTYDKAGTYGPDSGNETIQGDVIISSTGVTLQNVTITGNLILAEGIGSGDAFLNNVTVQGTTTVQGGGENSIHFKDTVLVSIVVNKKTGTVRIVAEGSTSVKRVEVHSAVKVEESGTTGKGFENVELENDLPANSKVSLLGNFETVDISAKSIAVEVPRGSIATLNVDKNVGESSVNLSKEVTIKSLVLNAVLKVLGAGKIEKATVNEGAKGSTFETQPSAVDGAAKDSVTVTNPNGSTSGNSEGSSSGGSSHDDNKHHKPETTKPSSADIHVVNYADGADELHVFGAALGTTIKVYDAATGGNEIGQAVRQEDVPANEDPYNPTKVVIENGFHADLEHVYVTFQEDGKTESERVSQTINRNKPNAPIAASIQVLNYSDSNDGFIISGVPSGVRVAAYDEAGNSLILLEVSAGHYEIYPNIASGQIFVAYYVSDETHYTESARTAVDVPPAASNSVLVSGHNAAFDKSAQQDVTVSIELNGNTLESIVNESTGTALVEGADYSLSTTGDSVLIHQSYLANQAVGQTALRFNFSAGYDQMLYINVSDSTAPVTETTAAPLASQLESINNATERDFIVVTGAPTDAKIRVYDAVTGGNEIGSWYAANVPGIPTYVEITGGIHSTLSEVYVTYTQPNKNESSRVAQKVIADVPNAPSAGDITVINNVYGDDQVILANKPAFVDFNMIDPVTLMGYGFSVTDNVYTIPDGFLASDSYTAIQFYAAFSLGDFDAHAYANSDYTIIQIPDATNIIDRVIDPGTVTGVTYGAAKTAEGLGLPDKVQVILDDVSQRPVEVGVDWDVAGSAYNRDIRDEQTFTVTGTLTGLPTGVLNRNQVTASITVTIEADPTR